MSSVSGRMDEFLVDNNEAEAHCLVSRPLWLRDLNITKRNSHAVWGSYVTYHLTEVKLKKNIYIFND